MADASVPILARGSRPTFGRVGRGQKSRLECAGSGFVHVLEVLWLGSGHVLQKPEGNFCGGGGGAKAVVDVDDGDAWGAAVEHGEQGGDAAKGCAVAHGGGHGDQGLSGEAGDDTGQGAVHAGDDDQDVGGMDKVDV